MRKSETRKVKTWTAIPGPCMSPGTGAAGATLMYQNMVITMVMTMKMTASMVTMTKLMINYDDNINDGPPDSDHNWHLGILLLRRLHLLLSLFLPRKFLHHSAMEILNCRSFHRSLQWKVVKFLSSKNFFGPKISLTKSFRPKTFSSLIFQLDTDNPSSCPSSLDNQPHVPGPLEGSISGGTKRYH